MDTAVEEHLRDGKLRCRAIDYTAAGHTMAK